MKDQHSVTSQLSIVLKDALTIINQLFVHAKMLNHQGIEGLGSIEYKASIKAMKMADDVIERILFLDGLPNLQALGKLFVGESTAEMIQCDLDAFTQQRLHTLEAVTCCEATQDYVSSVLLRGLLTWQEESIDFYEEQIDLIDGVGIEHYIQSQLERE